MLPAQLSDKVMDARSLLARLADDLASAETQYGWIVTEIDEVRAILSDVQLDLKEL